MSLWYDKRYKVYRYVFRDEAGKQRMIRLSKDKKTAEVLSRDYDRKRELGQLAYLLTRTPIADHLAWFVKYHLAKRKPSTRRAYGFSLKKLAELFEREKIVYLDQITRGLWERFELEILARYAVETRNDIFNVLSVFVTTAVANKHLPVNPLAGVRRRLKNPRRRLPPVWTDEKISAVRAAADPVCLYAIDLVLLTGQRRIEVWALDRDDIDFGRRVLTVQAKPDIGFSPKDYQIRSIDLSDQAVDLLRALCASHGDRFLISRGNKRPRMHIDTLDKMLARARIKAGVAGGTWHDLRRTYGTRLMWAGVPTRYIQHVLGHEDLKTTENYLNPGGEVGQGLGRGLTYGPLADNPAQALLKQKRPR